MIRSPVSIALALTLAACAQPAAEPDPVAASSSHYRTALTHHSRGEFEKAALEARKAVEADIENLAARKLLNDLRQIAPGGQPGFGARSIAEQSASAHDHGGTVPPEIAHHVRNGERYFNAKMYHDAIREFENAELKIVDFPYEMKAVQDLLLPVREFIVRSRNGRATEERRIEEEKKALSDRPSK